MPINVKEERLRWILPIVNKELKIVDVMKTCPHGVRSVKRWLSNYKKFGEEGLIPKSTRPKSHKNETEIGVKEIVIAKRKETGLCAFKLHYRLKKLGTVVPISTISKIIKQEKLVKKYRSVKLKIKYIKAEWKPGELIEIDTKFVPSGKPGVNYYQYTAIDTSTRWRFLKVYDEQSTFNSINFLRELIKRFPHKIKNIKTDNGSIFTNYYLGTNKRSDLTVKTIHALDVFCAKRNIKHYLIDPGKPAQNGRVERSHREDEEKFYQTQKFDSFQELEYKIKLWNNYYNDLEHCSLVGKTPNEMLKL